MILVFSFRGFSNDAIYGQIKRNLKKPPPFLQGHVSINGAIEHDVAAINLTLHDSFVNQGFVSECDRFDHDRILDIMAIARKTPPKQGDRFRYKN